MKTMKKQYRQGDVFIERVDKIPSTAKKQKSDARIILAHGEVTGHHHSMDSSCVDEFLTDDGQHFFEVRGKEIKIQLPIIREWKNQVMVEHPQLGLVEFSKHDVTVKNKVAYIDGDFGLLKHQEHNAQGVLAGTYRGAVQGKTRQREYSPESIRNVQD